MITSIYRKCNAIISHNSFFFAMIEKRMFVLFLNNRVYIAVRQMLMFNFYIRI